MKMKSKSKKLISKIKVIDPFPMELKLNIILIFKLTKIGNITGETFNFAGKGSTDAVAYGKGSNGGYAIKNENNFIKPQMVTKLPAKMSPPAPGPLEAVEEVRKLFIIISREFPLGNFEFKSKIL